MIREEGLPRGAIRVVYTTMTVLSPQEAKQTFLSRQSVHFLPSTVWLLLIKLIAICSNFVQPSVNVADKRITRLNKRDHVWLVVAVIPSMSEKDIDVKHMFSAIIICTGIKTMGP